MACQNTAVATHYAVKISNLPNTMKESKNIFDKIVQEINDEFERLREN